MLLCEVSLRYEAREATERSEVTLELVTVELFGVSMRLVRFFSE